MTTFETIFLNNFWSVARFLCNSWATCFRLVSCGWLNWLPRSHVIRSVSSRVCGDEQKWVPDSNAGQWTWSAFCHSCHREIAQTDDRIVIIVIVRIVIIPRLRSVARSIYQFYVATWKSVKPHSHCAPSRAANLLLCCERAEKLC